MPPPVPNIAKWTSGLFVPNRRSIGGIHAQVTISEEERDELQITEHPVEQGAPISDHAFKRPAEVRIKAGWQRGDIGANGANGMYGLLLSWQAALNPFNLYTGKRVYKNMLIQSLTVTTDSHSNWALMADLVLKQVIIVAVSTSKVSSLTSTNPNNQKDPASNASPDQKGDQQPRSVGQTPSESSTRPPGSDTPQTPSESSTRPEVERTPQTPSESSTRPEAEKVENTVLKNDPGGIITQEKGIGTGSVHSPENPTPPAPYSIVPKVLGRELIAMTNRQDYQKAKQMRNVMASWPRM